MPPNFGFPYSDDVHLRAIHRLFGTTPLSTYPVMSFVEFLWLTRVRKQLNVHRPLNFIDYNKDRALELLRREYDWRDYGAKHSESRFPDPRAFALHKAWLSGMNEREPLKKPRDLEQARSVAKLVVDEMPHLPFESTLTSLHGDVRKMLPRLIESS